MIKVAVTGNIGSGKSTVCKIFASLGISTYNADNEAKKFYEDTKVQLAVKDLFGDDIFDDNGNLQYGMLASIVFKDEELLNQLNRIIHPLVLKDFLDWTEKGSHAAYLVYESALLFESGFNEYFDHSILVTAPFELAMSRVMTRDRISADEFKARMARQKPESEKRKLADHIITNDGTTAIIPQVMALHSQFATQKKL